MPELSIIVPVYKVEKYLPKCIDSILAQTFRDFELILIDDGSPDNCGAICDEYAARDSRIKVIHQANAGVSAARNAGLDIASGTYLGFVDSDDWIEPEMYGDLVAVAQQEKADVVCSQMFINSDPLLRTNCIHKYSGDELMVELFSRPSRITGSSCNKLFLRERIITQRFPEDTRIWEDHIFLFYCFSSNCRKGVLLDVPHYHYRKSETSASQGFQAITIPQEQFIKYIYGPLKGLSAPVREQGINHFLDSLCVLVKQCRAYEQEIGKGQEKTIRKIKWVILKWTVRAGIKREICLTKVRRYTMEVLRT